MIVTGRLASVRTCGRESTHVGGRRSEMKTERMPWTCQWSEFRAATPSPMWMDAWMAQWACLVEHKADVSTDLDRCADCQKWVSRDERVGQRSGDRELRL
jgi:hypothetical protein